MTPWTQEDHAKYFDLRDDPAARALFEREKRWGPKGADTSIGGKSPLQLLVPASEEMMMEDAVFANYVACRLAEKLEYMAWTSGRSLKIESGPHHDKKLQAYVYVLVDA